jgi:hypothetical protein
VKHGDADFDIQVGALRKLVQQLAELGLTDLAVVNIRDAFVESQPALILTVEHGDQRETWKEEWLLVGDGVVKLGHAEVVR